MTQIYKSDNVIIKSWVTDIESGAIDQARNVASLPFAYKWVALMPDCHQGYGMPIGGVLAADGVVIPNAVGVDIGCGMIAVKSCIKVKDFSKENLKKIMGEIRKSVPVGFKKHKEPQTGMPLSIINDIKDNYITFQEFNNARLSLGTLGGGNHFIEIQKGDDGYVWIMIHSGSRNLGLKVANHYNKLAKELNKTWHIKVPESFDLAYLPINSKEGKMYLEEMNYCLEFAQTNRDTMMKAVQNCFYKILYGEDNPVNPLFESAINIHHNYANIEHHFGKNVIVHRKGATSAEKGQLGIIPGSQGTCSYIVKGLGNIESFKSCSHGAGRLMGRNDAKRRLNLEVEKKKLDDKGIVHGIRTVSDLDEASGAYKDIDVVMENQKDLVEIVIKLEPMGVIKG